MHLLQEFKHAVLHQRLLHVYHSTIRVYTWSGNACTSRCCTQKLTLHIIAPLSAKDWSTQQTQQPELTSRSSMPTLSAELVGDSAKHCAQFVGLSILRSGAAAFADTRAKTKGHAGRKDASIGACDSRRPLSAFKEAPRSQKNLHSDPQLWQCHRWSFQHVEKCLQTCTPAAVPGCMSNLSISHINGVSSDLHAGEEPNGRHSQPPRTAQQLQKSTKKKERRR